MMVHCQSKAEVERLTNAILVEGTVMMPLGEYPFNAYYSWVKDKYGMTWQFFTDEVLTTTYKVAICLLFADKYVGQALPALEAYGRLFNASVESVSYYQSGEAQDERAKINFGQLAIGESALIAMDHGYTGDKLFSEAISLMVYCQTQAEIDEYWSALNKVEASAQCGWCKDEFGVSWQIVPEWLMEIYQSGNEAGIRAVNEQVYAMKKLELAPLQSAFEGVK